ncbi:MAG: hypothetical protein NC131_15460, partial [Roseburia sp.]|nr:hypothetical protein [Roseburia sp.]
MGKYEFQHERTCKILSAPLTACLTSLALLLGLFLLPVALWGGPAEGKTAAELPNFAENRTLYREPEPAAPELDALREGEPIRVLLA